MKLNEEYLKNKKLPLASYVSIIYRQYLIYLNNIAEKMDINASQFPLLVYLLFNHDVCQNDIADSYKIDKASIARSVRKLEEHGLVKRTIDDSNRKKYKVSLTEKGKEIALKIKEANEEWENSILNNLEIEDDLFIYAIKSMAFTSIHINSNNGGEE